MSPQDSQMLHDFLSQLIQARGIQKDPEADALIQRAVAQQPDAAYLLVQRALLLEQALGNAKDRIASLESQLQNSGRKDDDGRFLDANTWGNSGRSQPAQSYQRDVQQPYQSQPQPQYQPQYQSAPSSGFLRGGLGSTLGSIAATAAGVAAGGFLFQGLENMFGHHSGGNRLLNSDDPANNLFSDQSGSALAEQAGVDDVERMLDNGSQSEGLFDSSVDSDNVDSGHGFFDGDGSDEGLFS
jgi:hypothetical protein